MRQIITTSLVLILILCANHLQSQTLITALPAQDAVAYTPVKSGQKQIMMGGLAVTSGFALGQPTQYLIAPEKLEK
ncbi:MAG: hypothetical protein K2K32_04620 [Muribaculaceae bacterium]|nr:hypothetical protein [Muribaculaceae bacterium]